MRVEEGRGKGKGREGNNQKKETFLITTPQEPRGQAEDRIEYVETRDRVKKVRGKGLSVQHMGRDCGEGQGAERRCRPDLLR